MLLGEACLASFSQFPTRQSPLSQFESVLQEALPGRDAGIAGRAACGQRRFRTTTTPRSVLPRRAPVLVLYFGFEVSGRILWVMVWSRVIFFFDPSRKGIFFFGPSLINFNGRALCF